jgi:hypothetical protein
MKFLLLLGFLVLCYFGPSCWTCVQKNTDKVPPEMKHNILEGATSLCSNIWEAGKRIQGQSANSTTIPPAYTSQDLDADSGKIFNKMYVAGEGWQYAPNRKNEYWNNN